MEIRKAIDGLAGRMDKLKTKRAELKKGMDSESQKRDPGLKRLKKALRRAYQKKVRLSKAIPPSEPKAEGSTGEG